jgi:glycosyltransferase involved in cell wall biosynthesis
MVKAFTYVKEKDLDYLFIVWGIPFRNRIGAVNKQLYSIANKFCKNNKKVGILYISYYSVMRKYNMAGNQSHLFIKSLISKIIYSGLLARIALYLYRKNTRCLNAGIKLYASGIKIPAIKARHIVTSYWWAVLLALERYPVKNIYFILYHDYSMDIIHSNMDNIHELQRAYASSNLILANRELAKKFQGNYPVITEGIDTGKYLYKDNTNKKIENIVLIPLRNNPLKGAEYVIPALEMIHNKFPELNIVAYGDYQGDIPDFIDFQGIIPEATLREYYLKTTYFILPSIEEGIPEPLLEAMAGGCACVSTACGGPQESIINGINGLLVPVRSPESIFLALKTLYLNRGLTEAVMKGAIRTAGSYDLNRTYEDFKSAINFYRNKEKLQ